MIGIYLTTIHNYQVMHQCAGLSATDGWAYSLRDWKQSQYRQQVDDE